MDTTYILTAELDDESFAWLDDLRREHFPPERNLLPAHLTLFHRLSPVQVTRLRSIEVDRTPIALCFDRIVFLGFGVALHVRSAELERLRRDARTAMGGEFSRQNSQPWKPHVTVQNKVTAASARQLQYSLEQEFSERVGAATGLLVWEYLADLGCSRNALRSERSPEVRPSVPASERWLRFALPLCLGQRQRTSANDAIASSAARTPLSWAPCAVEKS